MTNVSRPHGLQPYEDIESESPYVAGGTVYPGDVVRMNASGQVVAASADTNPNLGVSAQYATTGQECKVWDHDDQKYTCQSTGADVEQAAVGLNYQLVATTGDTTYKQSRMVLDATSGASNSNLPLRMLAISPLQNNSAGTNAKVVVVLNNTQIKAGTPGV